MLVGGDADAAAKTLLGVCESKSGSYFLIAVSQGSSVHAKKNAFLSKFMPVLMKWELKQGVPHKSACDQMTSHDCVLKLKISSRICITIPSEN